MSDIFNRKHEVIESGTFHNTEGGTKMILIHKEADTKKDAVRVIKESSIPDFLKEAIKILNQRFISYLSKWEKTKLNKKSTNRKGDCNMKKISIMLVTVVIMVMALTGCGNSFKQDENHAKVSWTASNGWTANTRSFNGAGMTWSGQDIALKNKAELTFKRGDKVHLTFECDACGDVQEFDIEENWAKTLSCKCPEEIDENGNAKEYYAASVRFED